MYVDKGKTLEFTGRFEKIRDHWTAFVANKTLERSKKMSAINKINAAKKEHHHRMGSGGYLKAQHLWDKAEIYLIAKGVEPETLHWPDRSRTWFFGVGELWTLKQGSDVGQTSNLQHSSQSFRQQSRQHRKGHLFLIERTTSSHRPSGILSTLEEHDACQAPLCGRLGFPTQVVTKPKRGGGKWS